MVNHSLNVEISKLKSMTSSDAAAWVISEYPVEVLNYGDGILLLPHRSWKKEDQIKLANHFFRKIPFASAKPYEIFSSFMSITNFIRMIDKYIPNDKSDIDLLKYYLNPVLLKHASTDSDKSLAEGFLAKLDLYR